MPGSVPHTSTYALTNATLPYVVRLADAMAAGAGSGWKAALRADASLAHGLSAHAGQLVSDEVAQAHGLPRAPLADVLA